MIAEQITPSCTFHGEGPVWDAAENALRFVDLMAGVVLTLDVESGRLDRRRVGTVAACLRPREAGGYVLALERSFALVDAAGELQGLPEVWSDPAIRFNDGSCDPAGRFYCGSVAYRDTPGAGSLYRLDADGTVSTVLTGVTVSNGLAFTPDGATAFYADTPTQRIDRIEVDPATGGFGDRRPWVTIDPADGAPDGLTMDSEGGIWVALWNGGAVRRYDADGNLDAVVRLPVPLTTCPAFGGPAGTDLFVTTSRVDVPEGELPEAGAIFRIDTGIKGAPVYPFAA